MSGKKLKIKLLPNGEIQMETQGVKGKKCLDYIDVLKKLVDVKITDTQLSQEYYETESEVTNSDNAEIRLDQLKNSLSQKIGNFLFINININACK